MLSAKLDIVYGQHSLPHDSRWSFWKTQFVSITPGRQKSRSSYRGKLNQKGVFVIIPLLPRPEWQFWYTVQTVLSPLPRVLLHYRRISYCHSLLFRLPDYLSAIASHILGARKPHHRVYSAGPWETLLPIKDGKKRLLSCHLFWPDSTSNNKSYK